MWIFLHKLFGWDYVYIKNFADSQITRVKIAPNGTRIFMPYSFQVNVINELIPVEGAVINGWNVIPLTKGVTV